MRINNYFKDYRKTNSNLKAGEIASQSTVFPGSPSPKQTPHFNVKYKSEGLGDISNNKNSNNKRTKEVCIFERSRNKKAQLTIFVIFAIIIVAGIGLFFVFKGELVEQNLPKDFEPVYSYYLSCIQEESLIGVNMMGMQGGYIENPEFFSGSEYMPFSSQLDFLGNGVPYWHYVSGNGVPREQKPSKEKMQSQLNDFLKERISGCDFSEFEKKGFVINLNEAEVDSNIKESSIGINVKQDLSISFGDSSWNKKIHSADINSNLGRFYNLASEIYSSYEDTMFLENYGVDILRLYAPVDGSEIGCSVKIWSVDKIRGDLMNALEANIPFTKIKGDYYTLSKKENKYFVRDIGKNIDTNVNFMYQKQWPMKLEVWPSEDNVLRADPVGLQEGLGMLGFCYVPYHFLYDFAYPVLIQIYSGNEIFQFPVVVFINKNNPRKTLNAEALADISPELCKHKISRLKIFTYNNALEPVEANIKFKCFDNTCYIGETISDGAEAKLEGNFPQCINGFIIAEAEGYKSGKYLMADLGEESASIILNKKYKLDLEIQKSGRIIDDYAVISLEKDRKSLTIAYPEQKEIEISEGQYKIKVYSYSNSSISLKGSVNEKCVEVPETGILGIFGKTEKKCFNLQIPEQIISYAVSGGGTQNYYISESELQNSRKLIINIEDFGIPLKIEDLQLNYNKIETTGVDIRFE